MNTYKGKIVHVFYSSPTWSSVILKCGNRKYRAAGFVPNPVDGASVEIVGEIIIDPKYGEQLKIEQCKDLGYATKDGLISYFTSSYIHGVGVALANRIYDAFGMDALDVLRNTPEEYLKINGISKKKLNKIIFDDRRCNQISLLLNEIPDLTDHQIKKIIETYQEQAIQVLKTNPYQLIYDIDGFGFLKVDKIAQSAGITKYSLERIGAAIGYVLKDKSSLDGHCYLTLEELEDQTIQLLAEPPYEIKNNTRRIHAIQAKQDDPKQLEKYFKTAKIPTETIGKIKDWLDEVKQYDQLLIDALLKQKNENRIHLEEHNGTYLVYLETIYQAECHCAQFLAKQLKEKPLLKLNEKAQKKALDKINSKLVYKLGHEQYLAILKAISNPLTIITGGPGRGKTTIVDCICKMGYADKDIVLCAPTGRAAQKMKEATGREALTIQKLIVQRKQLSNKLIIVDETSMIDIVLASNFFRLLHHCNLVFVGDINQLPSIGPGSFLKDMIQTQCIPCAKLLVCYRNTGAIEHNSDIVNDGGNLRDFIQDQDFHFYPTEKNNIQHAIVEEYQKYEKKYGKDRVCILAPMRARSTSAVEKLNTLIQRKMNQNGIKMGTLKNCDLYMGDRVMQTRNHYDMETTKGSGVFNGDCGTVIDVLFDDNLLVIQFDDGRIAEYDSFDREDLVLAYAITIHKSQGSEYDAVITVLNEEHYIMAFRKILYTAITRGKKEESLIGNPKTIAQAIKSNKDDLRNTKLISRIVEEVQGGFYGI